MENPSTNASRQTGQPGGGAPAQRSGTPSDGGSAGSGQMAGRTQRGHGAQLRPARRERGDYGQLTRADQSPFASLWQISREMDRLMDAFFGGGLGPRGESAAMPNALWAPQIEVRQRGDNVVVCADLPGVSRDDIQIDIVEDGIALSGERSEQQDDESEGYRRSERSYGSFYRFIPLPEAAQADKATAKMSDGVLEIAVPLQQKQPPKRVQIQNGG